MKNLEKLKSLIGTSYGNWTVVDIGPPKRYKSSVRTTLVCKCICGSIKTIDKSAIITGRSKSCNCMGRVLNAGEQYNDWTVLNKANYTNKHNDQYYLCKCACGVTRPVRMQELLSGKSRNCGHNRYKLSRGAERIKTLLDEHKIDYFMEYIFEDLPRKRFDFAIYKNTKDIVRLIEFDGEQHSLDSKSNWHTDALVKRDKEKNEFALKNKIPLVRIPHHIANTVTYDDLFSDDYIVRS